MKDTPFCSRAFSTTSEGLGFEDLGKWSHSSPPVSGLLCARKILAKLVRLTQGENSPRFRVEGSSPHDDLIATPIRAPVGTLVINWQPSHTGALTSTKPYTPKCKAKAAKDRKLNEGRPGI